MQNTLTAIQCPKCEHEFELADAISSQIREEERRAAADELRERHEAADAKLQDAQNALLRVREEKKGLDETLKKREAELRKSIRDEERLSARQAQNAEVETLRDLLDQQKAVVSAQTKKEAEWIRLQAALEAKASRAEADAEKKANQRLAELGAEIRKDAEEASRTQIDVLKKQVSDANERAAEMQRKLEQGSQKLQGEVQELTLEAELRDAFPWDLIDEVKSGARGADVRHSIRSNGSDTVGVILWESKNAANWANSWATKLRDDLRAGGAAVGVIVTEALPLGIESFGEFEGVLVCRPRYAKQVAHLLRTAVLREAQVRTVVSGRASKAERLYDYLTGVQFMGRVQAVIESFDAVRENIARQKKHMVKAWAEQEKQIETITLELVGVSGDVRGIAGPDVKALAAFEIEENGKHPPALDETNSLFERLIS